MTKRNKKNFIASFIKEAEKLNICNSYKYLVNDLRDLFFDENDSLKSEFKKSRNWSAFMWEVEEWIREFIYNQEIIGYKVACDFLFKFDPSFRISLEEAEAEDRPLSALSSEDLAGLALRSILKDALYDIVRDLRKEEASK